MGIVNTITTSTELMYNYKQVEIFDQRDKFKAVQTSDGHSIFFGQSSNGHLQLVLEKSGVGSGWQKFEISTSLSGNVKTFSVSQNHVDGHIDIAVVVTDPNGSDELYLSLDNSNSDLSWVENKITWSYIPDDRVSSGNPKLLVDDVHLPESSADREYIIVDVDNGKGFIARYWINTAMTPAWNLHPLAFNISSTSSDKSLIGRKFDDPIDGIYTLGELNGTAQFVYTPLFNYFSPMSAPQPTYFDLSGTGITGDNCSFSLCKALSGATNETDIFIAGNGELLYLASKEQHQATKPQSVLKHTMLNALHELQSSVFDKRVVVWGLNDADQVFYLSCDIAKVMEPSAWSVPLPLMSEVSQISQYINIVNGGLTIFANTGQGKLLKGMQDPKSSRWIMGNIELPVLDHTAESSKEKSFSTTIHLTDSNDNPLPNANVTLTPAARTNLYINNVFYALNGSPITVKTDTSGSISIVEWTEGLTGTMFKVDTGDAANSVAIDPALSPLGKIKNLGTVAALENAQITNQDGSKSALLPAGLSSADKSALAQSITDLNTVHSQIAKTSLAQGKNFGMPVKLKLTVQLQSPISYIKVLWGDLVQSLKHFGEYIISLVKDAASDVWHFIVRIGEAVYGFVVDTLEKIAGALKSIWEKIVKGFEDLWNFLKFLFEWQDMLLTRDVYKQTIKIFIHRIGEDIQKGKAAMDGAIVDAESFIKDWAGQSSSPPQFDTIDHPLNSTLKGQPTNPGVHSAPGQMLQSHFTSNVHNANVTTPEPSVPYQPTWSGLTDLSDFTKAEESAISDLKEQVMSLLVSVSGGQVNADLSTILKKIVADIAIAALELFKLAADKILDFLTLLIDEAIKILDAPIYIPVVSDILKDLFGIDKLPSVLDIMCLIVAVPVTIGYKIATGHAPFVSGEDSLHDKITSATTYAELQANFKQTGDLITLDRDAQAVLFETFYVAGGIATIINGVLVVLDEEVDGASSSKFSTPLTITSVLSGITVGAAGLFKFPIGIQNPTMKTFDGVLSKINLAATLGFAVAPKAIAKIKGVKGDGPLKALGKEIGVVKSGTSAVLGFIGLVPQVYHIVEIIADGKAKTGIGVLSIMDSTQGVTGRLGKIAGFAAILDKEPESKQIIIIVQGVLIAITGGLQIAEAITESVVNK